MQQLSKKLKKKKSFSKKTIWKKYVKKKKVLGNEKSKIFFVKNPFKKDDE